MPSQSNVDRLGSIEHYSQRGPLEAVDWYVTCLRDVIARKPVRCLDEAEAGYVRATAHLEGAVEALEVIAGRRGAVYTAGGMAEYAQAALDNLRGAVDRPGDD